MVDIAELGEENEDPVFVSECAYRYVPIRRSTSKSQLASRSG